MVSFTKGPLWCVSLEYKHHKEPSGTLFVSISKRFAGHVDCRVLSRIRQEEVYCARFRV